MYKRPNGETPFWTLSMRERWCNGPPIFLFDGTSNVHTNMCLVSFAHSIGNYQISITQLPSLSKTHPQIVQKSGWSFPNVKHQVSTVTRKKRRKLKQKMDMCLVNSFKSSTLCCCYNKLKIQVDTLINIIIEIKVKCSFLSEDPWTRDKASHSNGVALATQKKKSSFFLIL